MLNLKDKLKYLKKQAHKRGLKIRKDKRLARSPYRAMHPLAGKTLKQPYINRCITYEPRTKHKIRRLVLDTNHELWEFDKMRQGWSYEKAHKFANRKQRTLI